MEEYDSDVTYCSQIEAEESCKIEDTPVKSRINKTNTCNSIKKNKRRTKNSFQQTERESEITDPLFKFGNEILVQLQNIHRILGEICNNQKNKMNLSLNSNIQSEKCKNVEELQDYIQFNENQNVSCKRSYTVRRSSNRLKGKKKKYTDIASDDIDDTFWQNNSKIPEEWLKDLDDW